MPYITILDFTTGEVNIHPYTKDDSKGADEIVSDLGYKESDCQ